DRPLVALRLNEARLQVVLQAQQYVTVRYRSVVLALKLAVDAGGRLQQFAQFGCSADSAAMEGVDDQPLGTVRQADKKMAGKGEPDGLPALGAARVHVENAESYRQALPAVDDAHQVGVLQVVIAQFIAGI